MATSAPKKAARPTTGRVKTGDSFRASGVAAKVSRNSARPKSGIRLNARESLAVAKALINPPAPNQALREAVRASRQSTAA